MAPHQHDHHSKDVPARSELKPPKVVARDDTARSSERDGPEPTPDESLMTLDAFGRNHWARLTRAAGLGAITSSADYRSLPQGERRDRTDSDEMSTLGSAGVDSQTAQHLLGLGFSYQNILRAAQDAHILRLSVRDRRIAVALTRLDHVDPDGRSERRDAWQRYARWLQDNKDELARRDAAIAAERDPDRKANLEAGRDALLRGGRDLTGVSAITRREQIQRDAAAAGAADEITRKIEEINGVHRHRLLQSDQDLDKPPPALNDLDVKVVRPDASAVRTNLDQASVSRTATGARDNVFDALGLSGSADTSQNDPRRRPRPPGPGG